MNDFITSLKAKIASNPFLSLIASSAITYVTMKYGPAISSVCSLVSK